MTIKDKICTFCCSLIISCAQELSYSDNDYTFETSCEYISKKLYKFQYAGRLSITVQTKMQNTLRCLILIYFSVYNVQGKCCKSQLVQSLFIHPIGDDPSCSENSWNAFACIQYLQRSLVELQDQMKIQAVHLESYSDELSKQSFQLENLSIRLDNQSLQMENQTAQLESHSVKLNTLADLSSTQSLQLEIVSSQVVTLSAVVTAQSTQLTAQSIQLTNHSSELFALIENSTSHSVQLATNSVKLDDQSAQLQSQSTQLNTHATQLTTQSALLGGLQNNSSKNHENFVRKASLTLFVCSSNWIYLRSVA